MYTIVINKVMYGNVILQGAVKVFIYCCQMWKIKLNHGTFTVC
jgi:hypothetical protein